jgi:signal transduction histidine kinase
MENSLLSSTPAADVMIVDDAPANLELLFCVLRDRGFKVRPVPSGAQALEAARRAPPDLILLDIDMPGMNGYEVCAQLKADANLRAIPVIFISAFDGEISKVKAFEMGGVDYVTKPYQFGDVEYRVRIHLELARLRRELEQHNAHLEETVARRTRELAEAHARLAIQDQAKSDFLSLISHELRTPLNGIFGAAELLLMACDQQDPETAAYAKMYEISRHRLMTLLDDALLLTQIGVSAEAGEHPFCRLEELLNNARAAVGPSAELRGVQVAPVPPSLDLVQGAPEYLLRALQSLLETALKFARAGTTVRLTQATVPGEISLFIEADGRTIPPEALPHFFDLLAIAKPITGVDDLGLAPALAERIVKLYGGTVSVENLTPPGIRLTVRLKIAGTVPSVVHRPGQ